MVNISDRKRDMDSPFYLSPTQITGNIIMSWFRRTIIAKLQEPVIVDVKSQMEHCTGWNYWSLCRNQQIIKDWRMTEFLLCSISKGKRQRFTSLSNLDLTVNVLIFTKKPSNASEGHKNVVSLDTHWHSEFSIFSCPDLQELVRHAFGKFWSIQAVVDNLKSLRAAEEQGLELAATVTPDDLLSWIQDWGCWLCSTFVFYFV